MEALQYRRTAAAHGPRECVLSGTRRRRLPFQKGRRLAHAQARDSLQKSLQWGLFVTRSADSNRKRGHDIKNGFWKIELFQLTDMYLL